MAPQITASWRCFATRSDFEGITLYEQVLPLSKPSHRLKGRFGYTSGRSACHAARRACNCRSASDTSACASTPHDPVMHEARKYRTIYEKRRDIVAAFSAVSSCDGISPAAAAPFRLPAPRRPSCGGRWPNRPSARSSRAKAACRRQDPATAFRRPSAA